MAASKYEQADQRRQDSRELGKGNSLFSAYCGAREVAVRPLAKSFDGRTPLHLQRVLAGSQCRRASAAWADSSEVVLGLEPIPPVGWGRGVRRRLH